MRVALRVALGMFGMAALFCAICYGITVFTRPPVVLALATGGELVWRNGTMTLRLTDEDCPFAEERDQLESEGIPPAKRYVVTQGARKRSGCWLKDMGGDVLTLEPDGREVGTIPMEWFRREASERAT